MKAPRAPRLDERRTAEFSAELRARAQAWIPSWDTGEGERDFGAALLDIAARFSSEVAERLDAGGEKMRRGFLDWLAVRGVAARPARMPVALKLADAARVAVRAEAPVRLQADAAGSSVVFETETDVQVVPGRLQVVVGIDAGADAFYLTAPGIGALDPVDPVPVQWELKSFAPAGAHKLQLDPDSGLTPDMVIDAAGGQYRIVQADKGIVTIEPGLDADLTPPLTVRKVTAFSPFGGVARNRQEHALYLGHTDLLNIEAAATIDVVGATTLVAGVSWEYWGIAGDGAEPGWQPLALAKDQTRPGAVTLLKPKGAIVPREIGPGNRSRWIRAYATNATGDAPMLQVDELALLVNCGTSLPACGTMAGDASPAAEAMANTTPLVLESAFYPLGKEPRQFDAFYLGSQEAFSKKSAKVQLCFELADPTFCALSALRDGPAPDRILAGVAADGALHLMLFDPTTGGISKLLEREPLQPPQPGFFGKAESSPAVTLDRKPTWRLPIWYEAPPSAARIGIRVATSAGDAVWVWHEDADPTMSGWESFGSIPPSAPTTPPMSALVHLTDAVPLLLALRGLKLYARGLGLGAQWTRVATRRGAQDISLVSIVPVLVPNASGVLSTSKVGGMVGLSDTGKLFRVSATGVCTALLPARTFRKDVHPVAIEVAPNDLFIAAVEDTSPQSLVADRQSAASVSFDLDANVSVTTGLDATLLPGGDIHVFAAATDDGAGRLISWMPYASSAAGAAFESPLAQSGGSVGGAPLYAGRHLVVPGSSADLLVSDFDPARRRVEKGTVETGVVVPATLSLLAGDLVVRISGGEPASRTVTAAGVSKDSETFYSLNGSFPANAARLDAYHLASAFAGTLTGTTLQLAAADDVTADDMWLYIGGNFFKTSALTETAPGVRQVTLTPVAGGSAPTAGNYVVPVPTGGRVAPFIRMSPPVSGVWDAALLARHPLLFPALTPREVRGKAFTLGVGNRPGLVVLDEDFVSPVVNPVDFIMDDAVGEWTRLLGDTSVNPELSWEYWNGRGWWKLPVTADETRHLKQKGALRFDVPPDLTSSDWAGKTNFWIRARLIGGDYGQEKVTVRSKTVGGVTEQTVERSSANIHAPSVLRLTISYGVCTRTLPTFVLAQDSGSLRDQSAANLTAEAMVEAFVPLAVALGRLTAGLAPSRVSAECPCECGCGGAHSAAAPSRPVSADAGSASVAPVTERALLIGLDAAPSGAPVNVFLLVEQERDHGAFAPLVVEALVADRFVPLVAQDTTRGLGESGIVSMAFTLEPTRRELFGRSLTWLRLAPPAGANGGDWQPSLRGAYLNGVWASATETLTRELLGSSEGAPDLTLTLARPPVLHDTLELRVREPLGDEERALLRRSDARKVLSDVEGLPGDWVLWTRVTDPGDEPANARVYALDEATGVVRFGNGLHGMIPPIGVDAIIAFSYKRTEPPQPGSDSVPGNFVAPRSPLNLVSPVESVETVISIDQSAGGAPPEPEDRVLRFGFARGRHRGRAVTLRDIEDLALQSSPDIAQAHAFARRGYVRLVVVMRGRNPIPSAAQLRELRRLLLESAPTSLAAHGALRITGPALRKLRVELRLRVDALDHAGALLDGVKQRLGALFDAETGGVAHDGWPLGVAPTESDVALALIDTPHLESIVDVRLHERTDDDASDAWPVTLASHELAVLDADPIQIQLETAEVVP